MGYFAVREGDINVQKAIEIAIRNLELFLEADDLSPSGHMYLLNFAISDIEAAKKLMQIEPTLKKE